MALATCLFVGEFVEVIPDDADTGTEANTRPLERLKIEIRPRLEKNFLRAEDVAMLPPTVRATTDEQGRVVPLDRSRIGIPIIATDNASVAPIGFTYEVSIHTAQGKFLSRFDTDAPGGATRSLSAAVPVAPSSGQAPGDLDDLDEISARIVALSAQVTQASEQVEEATADLDNFPNLVLLYENGLI